MDFCACTASIVTTAKLGAKNGVLANTYTFRVTTASSTSGSYSSIMIKDCLAHGMKPVCDHPSWCKNDKASLYIGQNYYIAYAPHRYTEHFFPSGWSSISKRWSGLCSYSARPEPNPRPALCGAQVP